MSNFSVKALILQYYDAFAHSNVGDVIACVCEDVDYENSDGHKVMGFTEFQAKIEDIIRCFDAEYTDVKILVDASGLRAAAEYTYKGTYRETFEGMPPATGQSFSVSGACFFEIYKGQIHRVTEFFDRGGLIDQLRRF